MNNSGTSSKIRLIQTTAGEWERERFSRKQNFIEAIVVILTILCVLWLVAYPFAVIKGMKSVNLVANLILVVGGMYLLLVAPFLHKDTAQSWGLGNPVQYWRLITTGTTPKRFAIIAASIIVFIGLNIVNFKQWYHVARFFQLKALANTFGLTVDVYKLPEQFPGALFVLGFGAFVSFLIAFCAIRYDNFHTAFRTALIISLPLLAVIFISAYIQRGSAAFSNLSFSRWALGVFGYVFWGFVQQLLFSSYFGTRFRKAFAPSSSPTNRITAIDERIKKALIFGVFGAIGGIAFVLVSISIAYGVDTISSPTTLAQLILWLTVFFFPLGVVYGYFYCKDKKRILVATLSASCFGMIHIDSYGLVAVTWILGIALVYVFMEDKNRNLVALGFIHGLLGSTFGEMFSKESAGILNVDYSVGPWNVENPTWSTLIIPVLVILAYLFILYTYFKKAPEAKEI
ncbi:MAG TPA: hypothetical protein PLX23_05840 [Candidatus Hydrogenedens sp.]|nr:hypothetical protein [Candidatus Hydrogenedens sp.]